MASPEECLTFKQQLNDLTTHIEKRYTAVHEHIRELREDFSDHLEIQEDRHRENMASRAHNTKAIETLTDNTKGMVDAWKTIANLVKFVVVIATVLGSTAAIHTALQHFNLIT